MNRIDAIFAELRSQGRRGLMPFVCGGYPQPGGLGANLAAAERAGACIAEIGIPFSDPVADGPIIAAAMHEAIELGTTPLTVMEEVAAARPRLRMGLVAMVSVSIVERLGGPEGFVGRAVRAGLDGLIVPDLPLEESGPIRNAASREGLTLGLLVAPTTPPERAARIAAASTGFVYLLARAGITGERSELPDVREAVERLRGVTDLPIACGFGISTPEQVGAVVRHADAAIVGSALVRRLGEARRAGRDPAAEAEAFVASLAAGL